MLLGVTVTPNEVFIRRCSTNIELMVLMRSVLILIKINYLFIDSIDNENSCTDCPDGRADFIVAGPRLIGSHQSVCTIVQVRIVTEDEIPCDEPKPGTKYCRVYRQEATILPTVSTDRKLILFILIIIFYFGKDDTILESKNNYFFSFCFVKSKKLCIPSHQATHIVLVQRLEVIEHLI